MNVGELIKGAAKAAKKALLQWRGKPSFYKVLGRGAGGDVTREIDLVGERAIIGYLKERGFPCTVISEESGTIPLGGDTFVFIDPLDGSTNFVRGIPFASVSIAIGKSERFSDVTHAVVLDVFRDELFYAERGRGAYLNDKKITPSGGITDPVLSADPRKERNVEIFDMVGAARHLGSVSLELCYVACGRLDLLADTAGKLRGVDIVAGCFILKEAGGCLLSLDGRPLDFRASYDERVRFVAGLNKELCLKVLRSAGFYRLE